MLRSLSCRQLGESAYEPTKDRDPAAWKTGCRQLGESAYEPTTGLQLDVAHPLAVSAARGVGL